MSSSKPKFRQIQDEDYFDVFASGVIGGMNPNKCTIGFFVDKPQIDIKENGSVGISSINRVMIGEVTVTPVQFKNIAQWMIKNVQVYESKFGKIELRKEDDEDKPIGFIS
jgi:hypothetical protein